MGAGSCNKERPPSLSVSVAVTHDIISFYTFFNDLYVYVVMSDGGFYFSSEQFLDGTFFFFQGVSLHCAVTIYRDSLGHG